MARVASGAGPGFRTGRFRRRKAVAMYRHKKVGPAVVGHGADFRKAVGLQDFRFDAGGDKVAGHGSCDAGRHVTFPQKVPDNAGVRDAIRGMARVEKYFHSIHLLYCLSAGSQVCCRRPRQSAHAG